MRDLNAAALLVAAFMLVGAVFGLGVLWRRYGSEHRAEVAAEVKEHPLVEMAWQAAVAIGLFCLVALILLGVRWIAGG